MIITMNFSNVFYIFLHMVRDPVIESNPIIDIFGFGASQ